MLKQTVSIVFIFLTLFLSLTVQAQIPQWTFLVYMAADNNLQFDAIEDLKQMTQVGSSEEIKIIVLHDTLDPETTTKIYEIKKDELKIIKDYKRNIDSGNWKELVDFLKFANTSFPSQKRALTIWNHGTGWDKNALLLNDKGIAHDDHSNHQISTPELALALKEMQSLSGVALDLIATDACLMQTIEVGYEIASYAKYFAASQEVEPYTGWPYHTIFGGLIQKPHMEAEELGTLISESYVKATDAPGWSRTFSLIRLSSLYPLAIELSRLSQELLKTPPSATDLISLIKKAQTFGDGETVDLKHFLSLLRESTTNTSFLNLLNSVEQATDTAIIYQGHVGSSVSKAHGLSLWTPSWSIDNDKLSRYSKLQFDKQSHWSDLIRYLYGPTNL